MREKTQLEQQFQDMQDSIELERSHLNAHEFAHQEDVYEIYIIDISLRHGNTYSYGHYGTVIPIHLASLYLQILYWDEIDSDPRVFLFF